MHILDSRHTSHLLCVFSITIASWTFAGCGGSGEPSESRNNVGQVAEDDDQLKPKAGQLSTSKSPNSARNQLAGNGVKPNFDTSHEKDEATPQKGRADAINPETGRPRILGDLLEDGGKAYQPAKMPIDEERVAAHGIRKLISKHLTLYTDLPSSPDVDELPRIFDAAVPQWCTYFNVPAEKVKSWKLVGFVINDKERFRKAGLLPNDLPPFVWGYQRGHEFWVYEQPTKYYRRHLLLHEGTHGFMNWHLGGTGPMWYAEGTAELLGTHRWKDGKLTLRYNPPDKTEVDGWGRVKIIKDHHAKGQILLLESVFFMRGQGQLATDVYGWCWAVCNFFDRHPRWQQAFRDMQKHCEVRGDEFTRQFMKQLQDDWTEISEQWQLYVTGIEYGYDVARAAVTYKLGELTPPSGATATIAADRGWQSSGYRIEEGNTYEITAAGRYTVASDPQPWPCEPGGVTIRYYNGHPLGMLVGAIRDDDQPLIDKASPLTHFEPIGLRREIKCNRSGTLYLRINESPSDLSDNAGELTVRIVWKS